MLALNGKEIPVQIHAYGAIGELDENAARAGNLAQVRILPLRPIIENKGGSIMIESYEPKDRNYHYIKVTFANSGYLGSVILRVGGNCKGASALAEGLDFWENCDTEDVENLVHNDCQLSLYKGNYDEYWFKITLRKLGTSETMYLEELDYQDLTDMIIAVEFVKVEPENYSG